MPSLLSVKQVTVQTWQQYLHHFVRFFEVSAWLLVVPFFYLLTVYVLSHPSVPAPLAIMSWVNGAFVIAQGIVTLWITIRSALLTLAHNPSEEKAIATHPSIGWREVPGYFWMCVLCTLAVIGGLFVGILPGIWLTLALSLSLFPFLDEKRTGLQAMARSMQLIKHRWWSVLLRLFVLFLSVFVVVGITYSILTFIVSALINVSNLGDLARAGNISLSAAALTSPTWWRSVALTSFLQTIPRALFAPLVVIGLSILYQDLKRTQEK